MAGVSCALLKCGLLGHCLDISFHCIQLGLHREDPISERREHLLANYSRRGSPARRRNLLHLLDSERENYGIFRIFSAPSGRIPPHPEEMFRRLGEIAKTECHYSDYPSVVPSENFTVFCIGHLAR